MQNMFGSCFPSGFVSDSVIFANIATQQIVSTSKFIQPPYLF